MNLRVGLVLLFTAGLVGCKSPKPVITDDTIVTSVVNGVELSHRHAVTPPKEFRPVNDEYRAMYPASVMSRPDFSGALVRYLETGKTYHVLGEVEGHWLAIAEQGKKQLMGYVPLRAAVKSSLYDATVNKEMPKLRRKAPRTDCVAVGGNSKACKNAKSGTWVID
ncbi:TPA: SH3 domain-containing protein [Escherichia coli]|nr:SH3 domain-containing protein [Escherichia coli]HEI3539066.1 SH3 domain-containing protein [Escherichia coli]HEI3598330.1 SH3 domain-containing protein [Escherichia coli]